MASSAASHNALNKVPAMTRDGAAPGLAQGEIPLLEFDPSRDAVIEPAKIIAPLDGVRHCVLCYFRHVISGLLAQGMLQPLAAHGSEMGELPLYEMRFQDKRLAVIQAPVGASFAAALLEELIARGFDSFMVCGGCGVLDRQITVGHLLIPTSAVRDEGTSYHYLPASREVAAIPEGLAAIKGVLEAHAVPYILTKVWTTDAIYRETPAKVALRKAEGCLAVEMEAAAYMAVARFRNVRLGQILYAGDDVSGSSWDQRGWQDRSELRENVFWLAAEACLRL